MELELNSCWQLSDYGIINWIQQCQYEKFQWEELLFYYQKYNYNRYDFYWNYYYKHKQNNNNNNNNNNNDNNNNSNENKILLNENCNSLNHLSSNDEFYEIIRLLQEYRSMEETPSWPWKLNYLGLGNCPRITSKGIQTIQKFFPKCKIVT